MTGAPEPSSRTVGLDTSVPHIARVYNYWLGGLELVEPGVVQLHRWRPGPGDLDPHRELANYGGVGRKP
jgi:S-adenosyl methyltransferase